MMGTDVTLSAFGAELFPTALRSTASGIRTVARDGGMVLGLALVSVLFVWVGSNWTAISLIAGAALLVPIIAWLALPETAGRTLEEISSPDAAKSGNATGDVSDRPAELALDG